VGATCGSGTDSCTFLRDVEKIPKVKWSKEITVGNEAAYDGNAVADASLFESGFRNDEALMVKIYGLSYHQVLTLSTHFPLIRTVK
jgi:hypothetical protein